VEVTAEVVMVSFIVKLSRSMLICLYQQEEEEATKAEVTAVAAADTKVSGSLPSK
jgi:hypothetical protein